MDKMLKLFAMKKKTENLIMMTGGALIGIINGFFGGGGGMLCVPLLEELLKVKTKHSHATTILIILPISIAGAITYIINGFFNFKDTLSVGSGVITGGVIGALLLKKLNSKVIAVAFALIMIAAGVKMIFF